MTEKDIKMKTKWDLSPFYNSIDDKKMEEDIINAEKAYSSFERKYRKITDYLKNEHALFHALQDYEKMVNSNLSKPLNYLSKLKSLDSSNQKITSKINLLSQRLTSIGNKTDFFTINLSKVDEKKQKAFLKSKRLSSYKYFLEKLFEVGKHTLTEEGEKVMSLLSLPSYSMWVDFLTKERAKQTIKHKGKDTPISAIGDIITKLKTQGERVALYDKFVQKNIELLDIAENELNAVVTGKKIEDELRNYKEAYDSTIQGYENDKETVFSVVKTVTESFPLAHKFFKIKAKMLNLKKLKYPDRYANVGKINKKISFEECYRTLHTVFSTVDKEFGDILEKYVKKGQVDAFPKVGKEGGAYCSPTLNMPTFVFLNYTDSIDSMMTFAHEMGHAIHTDFSKKQPLFYQSYTISAAEVASTLFETFVYHELFEKLNDEEKIIALHEKISDDMGTIFNQVAFFNFEVEMHKTIREKGSMSKDELAECFLRNSKKFLGSTFEHEIKDGYSFVGIPHFRYFFYVYTYAMGQIISKALYKKYSEDKSYIEKIKQFLSAGGSMSPEDIFKSIGVDIKKSGFWKLGMKSIEEDIDLLEKLVNKKGKR